MTLDSKARLSALALATALSVDSAIRAEKPDGWVGLSLKNTRNSKPWLRKKKGRS